MDQVIDGSLSIDSTTSDASVIALVVKGGGDPADFNEIVRVKASNDVTVFAVDGGGIANVSGGVSVFTQGGQTLPALSVRGSGAGAPSLFRINPDGAILMPNLPTTDPLVANRLWNDAGTLKISAG